MFIISLHKTRAAFAIIGGRNTASWRKAGTDTAKGLWKDVDLAFPKHGLVTFSWNTQCHKGSQRWGTGLADCSSCYRKENGKSWEETFRSRFGTKATAKAPCLCLRSSLFAPDSYQETHFPEPQMTEWKCYQLHLKNIKQETMRRGRRGNLWGRRIM